MTKEMREMTGATQKRLCVRGFAWRRTVGLLLTTLLLLLALCACSGREHVEDGDGLNNPGSTETDGQEMKSLTEPTLSLTLTVPAAWDDIAELSACDKGTAYNSVTRLRMTNDSDIIWLSRKGPFWSCPQNRGFSCACSLNFLLFGEESSTDTCFCMVRYLQINVCRK